MYDNNFRPQNNSQKIASILTVRLGSDRLPHKCLSSIEGKTLMEWISKRLPGNIIIATTNLEEDNEIEVIGKKINIPVFRGDPNDVIKRMNDAIKEYFPDAEFIFRALGDCPFIETRFVIRAAQVMRAQQTEAFQWALAPDTLPVYGSREFPFSRSGWERLVANSSGDEREHTDAYFHKNREKFKISYHEPPQSVYFRNYRLEIDWIEDLNMVRAIAKNINMDCSTDEIIRFLDRSPEISSINNMRVEKTGPLTSYEYSLRRKWMKYMNGQPIVSWDDTIWYPADEKATPVFCGSGTCLTGHGINGVLYTKGGDRILEGFIACNCGTGKYWKRPQTRKH